MSPPRAAEAFECTPLLDGTPKTAELKQLLIAARRRNVSAQSMAPLLSELYGKQLSAELVDAWAAEIAKRKFGDPSDCTELLKSQKDGELRCVGARAEKAVIW